MLFDLLSTPLKKNIFYIKLRNVSDTKKLIHNPFNVIFEELQNEFEDGFSKGLLKNSITVLDGLDELYMKDNLNANDIEILCKGILRECEKFPKWEVIITTRHGYVNFERLYKEDYLALSLKPLALAQQQEWLTKFQLFHPETWLTVTRLIAFHDNSSKTEHYLEELLNQPLLLYIIASLETEIDQETDRANIYNKLFDQIIDRKYSKDGQIENLKKISKEDLRVLLQEIAFEIFKSGKGYITTRELLENSEVKNYTTKIGNNNLSGTLKGILISFYFKETETDVGEGNEAGIEFFHKSLQEYLTAEKIVTTVFSEILNKDIKGKYVLRKEADFLLFLNELFATQRVTSEIWVFIEELIHKEDYKLRSELADRLQENMQYFFEKDFIHNYIPEEKNLLEKMFLTFYSYWLLLYSLNLNRNYILNKFISNKIITYKRSSEGLNEYQFEELYLQHQRLVNTNFSAINFFETSLVKTVFIDCSFNNNKIYESYLNEVEFIDCYFFDLKFYGGELEKVSFSNCNIYDIGLHFDKCKDVIFKKCFFEGSELFIRGDIKKRAIKFDNCLFSEENLESLSMIKDKVSFKNCKVRIDSNISEQLDYLEFEVLHAIFLHEKDLPFPINVKD